MTDDLDELLNQAGFDRHLTVLTRRQAEVLTLRERDVPQATIADRLETSRANVAGIEARARENVRKARGTVAFVDAVRAPVTLTIDPGTDVYAIPDRVYRAADAAGIKVNRSALEVIEALTDSARDALNRRQLVRPVQVTVTTDGVVQFRPGDTD